MNIEEVIIAVQRKLGVEPDGKAGPRTWQAIFEAILPERAAAGVSVLAEGPAGPGDRVDARSEGNIATLLPEVRPYARALVVKAAAAGISIRVISGTRTYAEQDALYEQGRTQPGPIVTKFRGGFSNHNFGIAFDVGVFEGARYLGESPKYKAVGAIGLDLGLDWGGSWKSFVDEPHFQLRPRWARGMAERAMVAELRRRRAAGEPVFG